MKRYMKYIKPYKTAFILCPLLMMVEVLGEVVLPSLMANIINKGVIVEAGGVVGNIPEIMKYGGIMIVFILLMAAGGIGGAYFGAKASINFAADLRKDAFDNVQKFSFADIDRFSTGSLVTRLTNDITQVQNLVNMMLRMLLRAPGMLIGAVIMAFWKNAQLALVILVIIPFLIVIIVAVVRTAFPRFQILQEKIDRLNATVREAVTNVRVIKSFVRGDYEQQKFEEANGDLKESSLRAFRVMITTMPLMGLAMNVTTLAVVWFGGKQIIVCDMAVRDLTAFTTYVVQILIALMMSSFIVLQSSRAIASAKRINEIIDCKPDITDDEAVSPDAVVTKDEIEFKDVSFRYYKNSEDPVLDKISFKINAGETVGIIGSTGSGKTTLVSMIPRLYDPDEGSVLVDGIDVKDYSLYNLREAVSMVLQKNVLFSGSIMENLKWGDEDASEEEIKEVAAMAQADGFISSFPEDYEMDLGQGGVNVSGGQKQRLCIARALLKKPKILILDDSTSAVDTATEALIRKNFKEFCPETTKIIIAQRISSVMEADKIVVIDDGAVVGLGNHTELMENCEAYREIYYSQMDKEVTA